MGLDIMYQAAYGMEKYAFRAGSYSGFNAFREALAKFVDMNEVSGFDALLEHSDCDGILNTEECVELHAAFVENRRAFKKFVEDEGDTDEEYLVVSYDGWEEWTGVCAKHGGRLIFC